jgi:excisionase family DNA binding protein
MSSNIKVNKICIDCGEIYIAKTTVTKYCSHKCASRAYKKRKKKEKLKEFEKKELTIIPQLLKNPNLADRSILSIEETCIFIGISKPTFYRISKSGQLQTTKIGRRVFVTRNEIKRLFNI